jgi:hypothetical protein
MAPPPPLQQGPAQVVESTRRRRGPTAASRRNSHVYKISISLWKFEDPAPRPWSLSAGDARGRRKRHGSGQGSAGAFAAGIFKFAGQITAGTFLADIFHRWFFLGSRLHGRPGLLPLGTHGPDPDDGPGSDPDAGRSRERDQVSGLPGGKRRLRKQPLCERALADGQPRSLDLPAWVG